MTLAPFLLAAAFATTPNQLSTAKVIVSFVRTGAQPAVVSLSDPNAAYMIGFQVDGQKPINLLNENCSWGYEMIGFQIMNPAGEIADISRKPKPWYRNVPSPMLVQPGETVTRRVALQDGSWAGLPGGVAGQASGWKIRAVLNIRSEFPLTNYNIWFGTAKSPWLPAAW